LRKCTAVLTFLWFQLQLYDLALRIFYSDTALSRLAWKNGGRSLSVSVIHHSSYWNEHSWDQIERLTQQEIIPGGSDILKISMQPLQLSYVVSFVRLC
jgi:hypothetical protein